MELPGDRDDRLKREEEKEIRERWAMYYYNTFCSGEINELVFQDVLSDLYYYADELKNDEQVILYNAAKRILKKMQLTDNVNVLTSAMIGTSKYRSKEGKR
jgi:hypothetical protein